MCIAMGIAEPIAINTMVTANIFAMSSHHWPSVVRPLCRNAAGSKLRHFAN
jgi:hypothetical protein